MTFMDGAGTTLTVSGGTVTYHELPGFDLAPREYEVPLTVMVTLKDVSWPVEPEAPRGMNRAQRRRKGRAGGATVPARPVIATP